MIKKVLNNNCEIYFKNNLLDIKYYSRIIEINNNKIELFVYKQKIIITGNDLIIKCMDEYEIVIKGSILGIQFINEQS